MMMVMMRTMMMMMTTTAMMMIMMMMIMMMMMMKIMAKMMMRGGMMAMMAIKTTATPSRKRLVATRDLGPAAKSHQEKDVSLIVILLKKTKKSIKNNDLVVLDHFLGAT